MPRRHRGFPRFVLAVRRARHAGAAAAGDADAPRRRRHRRCAARFTFTPIDRTAAARVDAIAAAAARAGLQFIILTDHGDGTAIAGRAGVSRRRADDRRRRAEHRPAATTPRSGCRPSPYPLAGTPDDVIEDVHRLGGFGIRRASGLAAAVARAGRTGRRRSTASSGSTPTANGATSRALPIARALLTYLLRAPESMATLLDRPDGVLRAVGCARRARDRWSALAGADAHARLGFQPAHRSGCGIDPRASCRATKSSFRAFSNHVVLDAPLAGDAAADAARVLDAIRDGRVYSVIDALATPGGLTFTATSGSQSAQHRRAPRD